FKDVERNKSIAVALDGWVKEYGAGTRGICGAGRLRLQPLVLGDQWRGLRADGGVVRSIL
ncbi:MAG TPA: hypothetical protein VF783_02885, partial [Terriglobales bacterium]